MKKLPLLIALCLMGLINTADARFYIHSPWHSRISTDWHDNWYNQFPYRTSSNKRTEKDPLDVDEYVDRGVIRTAAATDNTNSGLKDMQKKQDDMKKEMEKQRKEMEESFSKLSKPKEEPKKQEELPKQELPQYTLPEQSMQKMPELPKLEPAKLPDVPSLPQQQQLPSIDGMQLPQQNEQQEVTRTDPNKEPAKINVDQEKTAARVEVGETEKKSGFSLSRKTIIIMALVFLGVGVLFVLSK